MKRLPSYSLVTCMVLSGALLSACVTTDNASQAKLETEMAESVTNGMAVAETLATLSSHGFTCVQDEPPNENAFACKRRKTITLMQETCIHSVSFKRDRKGATTGLTIEAPACTRP